MEQGKIRKQPLKARWGMVGDSTIARRVKHGLVTRPLLECGLPFWPVHEIEAIERARLRGAGDLEVKELVAALMLARTQQPAGAIASVDQGEISLQQPTSPT